MRPTEYLSFKDKFQNILDSDGKKVLPNVKPVENPQEALKIINSSKPGLMDGVKLPYHFRVRNFDPPQGKVTHQITYYPKFFLNGRGMGGRFDGSGSFLASVRYMGTPQLYTFFMCEHDWDKSGANHTRGWHPAVCKKCGFDASIDSGD